MGGESVLHQNDGDTIVFHAYAAKTGEAFLQISTLVWVNGWPKAALEGGIPAEERQPVTPGNRNKAEEYLFYWLPKAGFRPNGSRRLATSDNRYYVNYGLLTVMSV